MHETDTETELRAVFARQIAQLPSQVDFDNKVRKRIRARQRAHRIKVLATSAPGVILVVAGAVVVTRAGDSSNIVQTQAPATSSTAAASTTTVRNVATAMIDVVGIDYRDAQQRLSPLNARVLLALDDTHTDEGTVTRTTPTAGELINGEIIVYVAWNRSAAPSPTSLLGPGRPYGSNTTFPPAGLAVGLTSSEPDDRCNREGLAPGQPVRFLHGELVGCVTGRELGPRIFVWLDQLDHANDAVATMPDLVGLAYTEATERLQRLDLPAGRIGGIQYQVSGTNATNPVSTVLSTTPAAGQPITRLGGVSLTLSSPPP